MGVSVQVILSWSGCRGNPPGPGGRGGAHGGSLSARSGHVGGLELAPRKHGTLAGIPASPDCSPVESTGPDSWVPDGPGRHYLTAAGGEARSAGTPDWPDLDHGLSGLWLCGPCSRRLVQDFRPAHPWHLQGGCTEEDVVGSGGLCPMFSRLFPPTDRDTQWTVSPGQLGQTPAGLP